MAPRDGSLAILREIADLDPRVRVVALRRNYGQTAAMAAGIDAAKGKVLIPMDADLQNDPADIGRLLEKLDEGYDVVSGWRKNRKDKMVTRKIPSMLANRLISWIGGVPLHDYGCSLKAYRRESLQDVRFTARCIASFRFTQRGRALASLKFRSNITRARWANRNMDCRARSKSSSI